MLSAEECDEIDAALQMPPIDDEVKAKVLEELYKALSPEALSESVCAVCDRLHLSKSSIHVPIADVEYIEIMRSALARPPDVDLPRALLREYDCSSISTVFTGALLSTRGVTPEEVVVCEECDRSLRTNKTGVPPKYAIANGFYVGQLPDELFAASWAELLMTQLATVVAQTRVMRGGHHRAIRSHCMVFDASDCPAATCLPRRLDEDSSYRVILAGSFTDAQTSAIRHMHDVRESVVRELLQFYKRNNCFYGEVEIDEEVLQMIGTNPAEIVPDRVYVEEVDISGSLGAIKNLSRQMPMITPRQRSSKNVQFLSGTFSFYRRKKHKRCQLSMTKEDQPSKCFIRPNLRETTRASLTPRCTRISFPMDVVIQERSAGSKSVDASAFGTTACSVHAASRKTKRTCSPHSIDLPSKTCTREPPSRASDTQRCTKATTR